MLFLTDVPAGVAIAEAVEMAKAYGDSGSRAFVNGVLSGLVRDSEGSRSSGGE